MKTLDEALCFESSTKGIEVALRERLRDVQLLFVFPVRDHDFSMPIEGL